MLTCDNLTLFKDNKKIFSNLGFSLSTSSALVITGGNGSGKTSLLKIIAGIMSAQNGKILWGLRDVAEMRDIFNGDMQFIGHKNFLKPELTVKENLEFYADLFGTKNAVTPALEFFSLKDLQNSPIKTLSAGWQQRVILTKLLACPATVWLLDEPSNNLDKDGKEQLRELIKNRVKDRGLVIITSHDEMFFDLGPKLNLEDFG
jgi:heme exporter protein A